VQMDTKFRLTGPWRLRRRRLRQAEDNSKSYSVSSYNQTQSNSVRAWHNSFLKGANQHGHTEHMTFCFSSVFSFSFSSFVRASRLLFLCKLRVLLFFVFDLAICFCPSLPLGLVPSVFLDHLAQAVFASFVCVWPGRVLGLEYRRRNLFFPCTICLLVRKLM
jgi:hypothetical protein